jgi:hypothetical protein
LVRYRLFVGDPIRMGLYTADGGIQQLTLPTWPVGCDIGFEPVVSGFQMRCDGTDTQALGLYHFDEGDTSGTPVAVADTLVPEPHQFLSVSNNQRYLEVGGSDTTSQDEVYDVVTHTLLPHQFTEAINIPLNTIELTRVSAPVSDDGHLLIEVRSYSAVLQSYRLESFDPNTGMRSPVQGYPNLQAIWFDSHSSLFGYLDETAELGQPSPLLVNRQVNAPPILGDMANPSHRWALPDVDLEILGVSPNGDIVVESSAPLDPSDTSPGPAVYVHEGPLP